jgi:MFS family permease
LFVLVADVLVLVLALVGLRDVNHKFERRLAVRYIIKKILRRKDIVRIYWVSFALEFFYSLMLVYTPIYLLDLGMTWSQIGLIFTLMLIPFVLIQYPAGVLADKKVGEKELIIFALALAALATLGIFFLDSKSVFVWGAVLFATRIGAALIEVLRDSYFYKRIDGHDVDMIDFFRTALPLAYIISAFLSFPILIFFPMKYVFLPVVLVLILAIFQALKLKDNKSEKEIVEAQR